MSKLYLAVGATTGVGVAGRRGFAVVVCHVQLQGGGTKLGGPKYLYDFLYRCNDSDLVTLVFTPFRFFPFLPVPLDCILHSYKSHDSGSFLTNYYLDLNLLLWY